MWLQLGNFTWAQIIFNKVFRGCIRNLKMLILGVHYLKNLQNSGVQYSHFLKTGVQCTPAPPLTHPLYHSENLAWIVIFKKKGNQILCRTVTTMFVQMFNIMWAVFSHGPFQLSAMNYWHSWGWKIWQIPAAFVGYKTARKWHDSSLGGQQLVIKRV